MNWNTREELRACLESLRAHPGAGDQEIIVIDNASTDGSAEMVSQEFSDVRLIPNDHNAGYARGTNQALDAAHGDLLLLLNPDVEITPGTLDTLAGFLQSHPDAAAVAPRLVHPDGRLQRTIRGFPEPGPLLWDVLGLARVFPKSRVFGAYRQTGFHYERPGPAPQPMASCLLLTRQAVTSVGPMDERFPLFFNDVDWSLRAWRSGWKIYYTPDATVIHQGGASTRQVRTAAVWESHRALLRFYDKHYKGRIARPLHALIRVVVTLGAWARTGRWGQRLDDSSVSADLHRQLERTGGSAGLPPEPPPGGDPP